MQQTGFGFPDPVRLTAGVDEVGRGPLAGPVVAAAVILPQVIRHRWNGKIRDSKQLDAPALPSDRLVSQRPEPPGQLGGPLLGRDLHPGRELVCNLDRSRRDRKGVGACAQEPSITAQSRGLARWGRNSVIRCVVRLD